MPTPTVSVLIAVYNGAPWIREAIESALSQSGVDIEVVVVDDGSTDDTSAVIDAIEDPRVVRDGFEKNRGKVAAFNRAFARSTGDAVALLGADDVLGPGSLVERWRAIADGAAGAWHAIQPCDAALRPIAEPWTGRDWTRGDLHRALRYNPISGGGLMLGRAAGERAFPIPEALRFEDWWLVVHTLALCGPIVWVDGPALLYRLHDTNAIGVVEQRMDPDAFERDQRRHLAFYDTLVAAIADWPFDEARLRALAHIARDNRAVVAAMTEGRLCTPTPRRLRSVGAFKWLMLTMLGVPPARRAWRPIIGMITRMRAALR